MNGKRIFVSTVITNSMIESIKSQNCLLVIEDLAKEGIDALRGLDFISALKDEPLVEFLNKKGIDKAKLSPKEKIVLSLNDELYVINPQISREVRKEEGIPDHTVITVTKYVVREKSDFVLSEVQSKLKS